MMRAVLADTMTPGDHRELGRRLRARPPSLPSFAALAAVAGIVRPQAPG